MNSPRGGSERGRLSRSGAIRGRRRGPGSVSVPVAERSRLLFSRGMSRSEISALAAGAALGAVVAILWKRSRLHGAPSVERSAARRGSRGPRDTPLDTRRAFGSRNAAPPPPSPAAPPIPSRSYSSPARAEPPNCASSAPWRRRAAVVVVADPDHPRSPSHSPTPDRSPCRRTGLHRRTLRARGRARRAGDREHRRRGAARARGGIRRARRRRSRLVAPGSGRGAHVPRQVDVRAGRRGRRDPASADEPRTRERRARPVDRQAAFRSWLAMSTESTIQPSSPRRWPTRRARSSRRGSRGSSSPSTARRPRRRARGRRAELAARPGRSSTRGRTFEDPQLVAQTEKLVAALGIEGPVSVRGFMLSANGLYCFTGVSPCFSSGLSLSLAAGADLVGEYMRGILGPPLRRERLVHRAGVTIERFDDEVVLGAWLDLEVGARAARRRRRESRPRTIRRSTSSSPSSARSTRSRRGHAQPAAKRIGKLRLAEALDRPGDARLGACRLLAAADEAIDDVGQSRQRRSGPPRSSARLKPDAGFRSSWKPCCTRFASL